MQVSRISGFLPILLQMLAPKMNVRLEFGNMEIGSAQKGIVTITNAVLQMKDRVKAQIMALGLLCHEGLGHIRQTDWPTWDAFDASHMQHIPLLNVIEDSRIEKRSWIFFPGVKDMLHEVCEVFVQNGVLSFPADVSGISPGDALCGGLNLVLRGEFLLQPTDTLLARKLLSDTFGQPLADEVIKIALEGAAGDHTQKAVEATLAIVKLLKLESEKPQDQNQDQKTEPGQDSGNGQSGSQSPDGQGNKDPQSNKIDNPSNSPSPSQKNSDNAAKALEQMANGQIQETDLGKMIQGEVDKATKNKGGGSTPIFGKVKILEAKGGSRTPGTEALSASRRMSAKLEQLMATKIDDDDRLCHVGNFDGNLAARVKLLDTQVFLEEGEESEGIDSAVLLLLDASSSMNNDAEPGITRADLCFNAGWATSAAMAKFKPNGVEMAIWGYGSAITKFVDFGGWSFQKDKFKGYVGSGGTSTFPACVEAIGELAKRKQKRKHLILFSDGDLGGATTELYLKEAMLAGIEVSIIFIGDRKIKPADVSKALEERVFIVHDVDSIVNTMFSCLKPH